MTEAEVRELLQRMQQAERDKWAFDRKTVTQMREWLKDLPERLQTSDEEAE